MKPKTRNRFLILFLIAFIATVVIYYVSGMNIELAWYFAAAAIIFYFIYRFSK